MPEQSAPIARNPLHRHLPWAVPPSHIDVMSEMKVLYFAWLRKKTGTGQETIHPPAEVQTLGGLVDWLKTQSPGHADALADLSMVSFAVNQEYAEVEDPVKSGDEIALFPPVTGG
jgi:molybdopterin synthase sulfur carrier subunit